MISVLIKSAKKFGFQEDQLRSVVRKILKKYHFDNCELSLVFVEPSEILRLNQKYRALNEATSVLTFFQGQAYPPAGRVNPKRKQGITPEKFLLLGDIVLCPEVAKEKNLTINFLLEHGIRNLLSEIPTAESLRT
jgi:ssRNA-specific RNase YbeY (16S rRNA maturation enzyme)